MPFSFTFHHDLKLVYKRVWGTYGDADSVAAHDYWDTVNKGDVGKYDELQDLSAATDYSITLKQIRDLADHYETWDPDRADAGKRVAYIAPSANAFGTGRVYSALISITKIDFKVFTSVEEGAEWLDISPQQLDTVLSGDITPDFVNS